MDRQQQIDKLRFFLQRSTNQGGIYLISGQRGAGKTWLVETALHTDTPTKSWINCLFGRIGRRARFSAIRAPRDLPRMFLKVDVDPMLPIENKKDSVETGDEFVHYTRLLLLNICFALTNTIDSRFSIRQYGRVLRERIGFFHFWFGSGLLWPDKNGDWRFATGVIATMSALQTSIWLLFGLWNNASCCFEKLMFVSVFALLPWLVLCALKRLSWLTLLASEVSMIAWLEYQIYPALTCEQRILFPISIFLIPITCWIFLRRLDWLALQNISAQLYNLAHAYDHQHNHEENIEKKLENKIDFSLILGILILISLIGFVPEEFLIKLYNELKSNLTNPLSLTFDTFKDLFKTITAISLLTLVFYKTKKTQDGFQTNFNKSNLAWLINLLRRYLFLCHRCGLEPVLVINELDKLNDLEELLTSSQHMPDQGNDLEKSAEITHDKPAKPNRLNLFLIALSRLKGNLGSEYLWILVGDNKIFDIIQKQRHETSDNNLGLLATVISQEDVLGPVASKTAEKYIANTWQIKWEQMATDRKWGSELNHHHFDLLWLRCYGNFATLIRECENLNSYFEVSELHKKLINTINELWGIESINELLNYHQTEVLDAVRNDWIYIGIRSGILEAGNRLITPILPDRGYFLALDRMLDERNQQSPSPLYDKRLLPEIHAIRSTDTELLRAAGAMLLYKQLKRKKLIRDIDKDKIEIVR